MYRVLMPVDENVDRSMSQGQYIADLPAAVDSIEVTVLYVSDETDRSESDTDKPEPQPEDIESVTRVMGFFDEQNIRYRTVIDRDNPVERILEYVHEIEANVIVLGGRKRSPTGKVLFGSVTMSVLRNTDIPVVVTGETSE